MNMQPEPGDTVLDLQDPTPAQISAVMRAMSRSRTPEQRRGGRPRGYVASEETRAKISAARQSRKAGTPK